MPNKWKLGSQKDKTVWLYFLSFSLSFIQLLALLFLCFFRGWVGGGCMTSFLYQLLTTTVFRIKKRGTYLYCWTSVNTDFFVLSVILLFMYISMYILHCSQFNVSTFLLEKHLHIQSASLQLWVNSLGLYE